MTQHIDQKTLQRLVQVENIETLSLSELVELFRDEIGQQGFLPDGVCQIDPRNNDRVLYNTSRSRRPHDNQPVLADGPETGRMCVVCQGHTTGVIDVAALSQGFTFINKNLYPSLFPQAAGQPESLSRQEKLASRADQAPSGLHFLQWTSSRHDRDWHNMPLRDRLVVVQRLAALERNLLADAAHEVSSPGAGAGESIRQAYVLIIKNYGRLVGGSLTHGHQQIALSNIMPRRIHDNWCFEQEHGETFASSFRRENPAELNIRDYGPALLMVPYFMRRPYDMILVIKDATKQHLFELNQAEITAVAKGWHDALRAIHWVMPHIGKEIAYNVVTHNGPGAGLYFEFLPYTQEIGGFEHLGLLVCQSNPRDAADHLKGYLDG